MSCLFYCICRHPGPEVPGPLTGVGGGAVYQVAHRDLSAAVSRVNRAVPTPDMSLVQAYERVVLSYHRHLPIIPLRYGCVLPEESRVVEHLARQAPYYEALLRDLADCVEMGLRVLLPSVCLGGEGGPEEVPPDPVPSAPAPNRLGLAYLTARKAHYARQDRWTGEYRRINARCQQGLAGLFVRCKTEAPSPRLPVLSLYFLVERGAVAAFRQGFRRLVAREPARLLLSGPWPPYNFVTGDSRIINAVLPEDQTGNHG
jgi:hypothetical protein